MKMSRSAHEKEWGRERDQLRKSEAVQQFNAMLADTVSCGRALCREYAILGSTTCMHVDTAQRHL